MSFKSEVSVAMYFFVWSPLQILGHSHTLPAVGAIINYEYSVDPLHFYF